MGEHNHDPILTVCSGCGRERWCGYGPCQECGAFTTCHQEVTDHA